MKKRLRLSYLLIRCFVFILAVAVPFIASAEPTTEEWVARYNGPANDSDSALAMAVDPSGNVYVTGGSEGSGTGRDYATVKYDTNGNELWGQRYNNLGNGYDYASAIAVDASGNVYVTGISEGLTNRDYATVKYDPNGTELWVKRYNGPIYSGDDYARNIAVDASGNVYVTGMSDSYGLGTRVATDYATVEYDTDGNELWVARYNGPGDWYDRANAIAIDAWGNVYVTGSISYYGDETALDYATVKYDANGNELWVKLYNGPGNGADEASDIAVDTSGNVYVTGRSFGSTDDYATVKYDANGNELWVQRYNGPGDYDDHTSAIAVDASGNVYVTGKSAGSETGYDYATVKYDTNGNELWVQRYNGPGNGSDETSAMVVDASGNVYVTGKCDGSGTSWDYATVQYDANGNELWVARYNGPGNEYDYPKGIAVDASGNVYVSGWSRGSGTELDYATVKYVEGVTIELPAGWSMISLPVTPAITTPGTLFPEATAVYRYEKGMGYVQVLEGENLEVGAGYWILLDIPQSFVIKGTGITEYTMPVENGWYMIGGCTLPAQKMVTNGNIDVIYGYTQGVGYIRLLTSEPLKPGKGYWILFSNTSAGAAFTASTAAAK